MYIGTLHTIASRSLTCSSDSHLAAVTGHSAEARTRPAPNLGVPADKEVLREQVAGRSAAEAPLEHPLQPGPLTQLLLRLRPAEARVPCMFQMAFRPMFSSLM